MSAAPMRCWCCQIAHRPPMPAFRWIAGLGAECAVCEIQIEAPMTEAEYDAYATFRAKAQSQRAGLL